MPLNELLNKEQWLSFISELVVYVSFYEREIDKVVTQLHVQIRFKNWYFIHQHPTTKLKCSECSTNSVT